MWLGRLVCREGAATVPFLRKPAELSEGHGPVRKRGAWGGFLLTSLLACLHVEVAVAGDVDGVWVRSS